MTNILFWNTYNNININPLLIDVIIENNCDIVILAEYKNDIGGLCNELSLKGKNFKSFLVNCSRIKIAASFQYKQEIIFDNDYSTIQNIKIFGKEFLIAALHLPSKIYASEDKQMAAARQILNEIQRAVIQLNHNNVLIIGDFNANPFEKVCINADCFHALPSKVKAMEKTRIINGEKYNMYYNPMWNLFGDNNIPTGTYYYPESDIQVYFWNVFDQVILSPDIAKNFENSSLKIIHQINNTSLLSQNGIPKKKEISDHLPIYFQIREELF